jgi:hypothetical protein
MANEDIQQESLLLDNAAAAARTAIAREAAETIRAQNVPTQPASSYKTNPNADADSALDNAFKDVSGKLPDGVPEPGAIERAPGVPDNPAEPKPKTPAEIAAEAAAEARNEATDTLDDLLKNARVDEETPAEPAPKERPAERKEDAYAEHTLASNASQKSKDSFENLKRAAAERESAQRARAEAAEAKALAAEAALNEAKSKIGVLTPELEQELKELREHRALFAREQDPQFKQKYDAKASAHYEAIYAQLRLHQLPEEEITKVKAMSKADRDAQIEVWTAQLQQPSERRPIELRQMQLQQVEEERAQELAETKAKAAEILKAERVAPEIQTKQKIDQISDLVRPNLKGMTWFDVKEIPKDTPPEQRKALEASNARAIAYREHLRAAIMHDDVQTRATAALAVPLSYYYAREAQLAKAELELVKSQLARITKAGATSRLSERASTKSEVPASKVNLDADARDIVDDLFKSASESAPQSTRRL